MHLRTGLPARDPSARVSITARDMPAIFRRIYTFSEGSEDVLVEALWELLNSGPDCADALPSAAFRATDGVGPLIGGRECKTERWSAAIYRTRNSSGEHNLHIAS